MFQPRVLVTVGGTGRYRPALWIFRPALGFKLDAPPGTNRTKICWICTNSIVFQASKVVVFAQCKFCIHYFAKDTHHTAREQNYFLEKCSEPVHCDPFGRTAIRAPISELAPAQTYLDAPGTKLVLARTLFQPPVYSFCKKLKITSSIKHYLTWFAMWKLMSILILF